MSASEAQELYRLLQECQQILDNIQTTSTNLETRVGRTEVYITIQQALRLMWRFQRLLRRFGLPEDVDAAVRVLNNYTRAALYAYYASNLLFRGDIYGLIAGGIGMTTAFLGLTTASEGY